MGRVLSMHLPLPAARSPYKTDSDISPPQKTTSCAHLLSWVVVVLGSSSLWLRLLRAVECWLAVVSKADADTPSLRGAILGAEGESDLTAGPVAPVNKELWVRGSSQRTVQWQGSAKVHPEELGGLGGGGGLSAANQFHTCDSVTVFYVSLCPNTPIGTTALQRASSPANEELFTE